jgi:replicative DNA helicase
MENRLPPQNIEAEQSVLGSILVNNSALNKVLKIIDRQDFYRETHRKIFSAMMLLAQKGEPIDLITLTEIMASNGILDDVGGPAYVAELADSLPTAANAVSYAKIVKDKSDRRKLLRVADELQEAAYVEDATDTMDSARQSVLDISLGSKKEAMVSHLLTLDQQAAKYRELMRTIDHTGFITGHKDIDAQIRRVAPGEVFTIIAYSGTFKSAYLQGILLDACERTQEYHIKFSIEMPAEKVFERTGQIAGNRYSHEIEQMVKNGKDDFLLHKLKERHADKLIVCDDPYITLSRIEDYVAIARERHGNIGAIGVDYLGLIDSDGSKKSEYEITSKVAREMKKVARRLNIPLIMLCQVNRTSAEGKIKKSSGKGAGDIEAASDFELGFWFDEDKDLVATLVKNRNGDEDVSFKVEIDRRYLRFESFRPYEEADREVMARRYRALTRENEVSSGDGWDE